MPEVPSQLNQDMTLWRTESLGLWHMNCTGCGVKMVKHALFLSILAKRREGRRAFQLLVAGCSEKGKCIGIP